MANKRYVVELSREEWEQLERLLKQARVAAKKRMRAQALLKVDEGEHGPGWSHAQAAEAFDVHVNTVTSVAKELVTEGLEAAISRKTSALARTRPPTLSSVRPVGERCIHRETRGRRAERRAEDGGGRT